MFSQNGLAKANPSKMAVHRLWMRAVTLQARFA
jgi:hypothetical protein